MAAKTTKTSAERGGSGKGLTAEEKAAMREYLKEKRESGNHAEEKKRQLAKIAATAPADRVLAKKIDAIVAEHAPSLRPKLWYGMQAYANKDDKTVLFFQDAAKFKARYATLGFNDSAMIDDGGMWPTSYAVKSISAADEARIIALVKKAVR